MTTIYECDYGPCLRRTTDLKGWFLLDRIGDRPQRLLCSQECIIAWVEEHREETCEDES